MPGFFADDSNRPLVDSSGLRPTFGANGIISATMSGSTQELAIPSATGTDAANLQGARMVLVSTSTQPAFIAFDVAGQSASYTGATNMLLLPQQCWIYIAISKSDTKFYVLQAGSAGSICLSVLRTA